MPFIHIKCLPFADEPDTAALLEGLCDDFTAATGIGIEHVTATWEWLAPGHYAVGGKAANEQPAGSHPCLVDLLAPDFNADDDVEGMLVAIADSLAARAGIARDNIFINQRAAHSGRVFDAGEIVRW